MQYGGRSTRFRIAILFLILMLIVLGGWLLTPRDTRGLLRNSLQLAVVTGLLAVPVSAMLAYVMSRYQILGERVIDAGLLVLLFLPLYVQLAGWEAGFGRGGWYSTLIAQRLSEPPLEGLRGAAWVHAVAAVPWLYWIFRFGFAAIPVVLEDAAALDAGRWQVFRRVTLPLTFPIIAGGSLFVAIITMTEITVTDRYQFRSYAEVLYNEYALNPSFTGLPLQLTAVVWNLAALLLGGLGVCYLAGSRVVQMNSLQRRHRPVAPTWVHFCVYSALLVLVDVPFLNLIYQAGIEVQQIGEVRQRSWSLVKCISLIATSPWKYRQELAWTAIFAQLSVLSSLSLATMWAWWSYGHRGRQLLGMGVCVLCFATPGTLIAFAIIRLLNPPNAGEFLAWIYDDTPTAAWLAMTVKCLPFACLLVWHGMRSIPRAVLDAARVDGASTRTVFWRVVLPLLRPALLAAALVCAAVSMGELSASLLVLPLDATTVSSRIFSLIHYGAEDQLAGLCLCCVAIMAILSLAIRRTLTYF